MIFDTHAHYDDSQFDADREEVLAGLPAAGVTRICDVSASADSLARVCAIADSHDFAYGAVGLHPDEVGDLTPAVMAEMREDLKDPKIAAVGEIGLDYHWDIQPHDVQIRCFREQIRLAMAFGKPILVHSRNAAADTLSVIEAMYGDSSVCAAENPAFAAALAAGSRVPGVIHSYSGSLEQAKIYTSLGFLLGVGGVLTYQGSKKLKRVVEHLPLSCFVLETDAPYLAPEPHKGGRNTSAYLPLVAQAVAEIKGVPEAEVERATFENALRLFDLRQ